MLGTAFQQELLAKLSELAPIYVVGGAVRDTQLGEASKDVDAVIMLPFDELEQKLRQLGYVPHRIGAQYETVTLFNRGERLDLTSFSGDLLEDALRRDFTINAIYWDVRKQQFIDPLHGLEDLANKTLRACGDPHERFREDPLRILRMVRIGVQRRFTIDADTWKAAQEMPLLERVASERITEELGKILLLPDVRTGLKMLDELGYWASYVPELAKLKGLVQNRYHSMDAWEHTLLVVANTPQHLLVRLAALFHDCGKWETASHECRVWGLLEQRGQQFFIGDFQVVEKHLQKWSGKYVKVLGARLDHYPDRIQVKHIAGAERNANGFEWIPDGKRHFLHHERESAVLVKGIFPRFRWSMVLANHGGGTEQDCIFLIANHMAGTLIFMEELRRTAGNGEIDKKSRQFAWRYGWNGREFAPGRVEGLLALWRADFLGGKVRAEGDLALLEEIQAEILVAIGSCENRLAGLDWSNLAEFMTERGIGGAEFGRFKEYVRELAVMDENLNLADEGLLEREYRRYRKLAQNTNSANNRRNKH